MSLRHKIAMLSKVKDVRQEGRIAINKSIHVGKQDGLPNRQSPVFGVSEEFDTMTRIFLGNPPWCFKELINNVVNQFM